MIAPSNIAFARDQRRLIERLLTDVIPDATSFAELLPMMKGAGPTDVVLGLRRLRQRRSLQVAADALISDALHQIDKIPVTNQLATLPLPHPLDSEWRFAPTSIDALVGRLLRITSPGDELLLVGTPSVAAALSRIDADRRIRFVGPDDLVTATVETLFADDPRFVRQGGGEAAAAVVDPPWYGGPFAEMLAACARGCRHSAAVLTVMPRVATRPGMAGDLANMMALVATLGLVPGNALPFEVRYRMPLFEACMLERCGLRPDLGEWRRGDCVTLISSGKALGQVARVTLPEYVELMLDGCRLRLTLGISQGGQGLSPIEANEVSASVSARSPTRLSANLWTTTNRAFRVDENSCLAAFAAIAIDEGVVLPPQLTHHRIEAAVRNGVADQVDLIHSLYRLFARESADASRLVGDGSWLRGAKGMRCLSVWSGTSQPDRYGMTASARSSAVIRTA